MESGFIGRVKELEYASEVLSQVISGHGSTLIISGPAGIGKTRFVEEIKRIAERTGCLIVTGHCTPEARTPYIPFIEAFSSKIDENPFDFVSGENNSPFASPQEMLFPTLETISKVASKSPLLIHIEDLQWADTPTIDLFHLIARTIGGLRIFIIGTYRSEDLESGLNIENEYFLSTLTRMKRAKLVMEIVLSPLRSKDLRGIAYSIIGSDLDSRTVRELNDFVEGNPLFFIEMIRYLSEKKLLIPVEGHLELVKGCKKEMPPSIMGLELQKFNNLTLAQKRIIEYASVVGERLEIKLLSKAFDLEKPILLDVLTSLSNNSCFIERTEGQYHFQHRVAQQAIYQNIPLDQRSDWHQKLAETIESMDSKNTHFSSLSDHYYLAGNREKALEFSIKAGEVFLKATANEDALIYLNRAESLLDNTVDVQVKILVFESLADVFSETSQNNKADQYYQKCLPLISEISTNRARLLMKRARCWHPLNLGNGDRSETMRFIEEAEGCPGLQPNDHADIESFRGFLDFLDHRYYEAKLHYIRAIKIFKDQKSFIKVIENETELVEIYLSEGKPSDALTLLETMNGQTSELGNRTWKAIIRNDRGNAYWHMGKLKEALQEYQSSIEMAIKICDYYEIIVANQYASLIYIEIGDFQNAEICLNNCLESLDYVNIKTLFSRTFAILAHLKLMQNNVNECKTLLAKSMEMIGDFSSPLNITSGIVKLVEAELMLSLGHLDLSKSEFDLAIELLHKSVFGIMFEAVGFSWYAEILKRNGHQELAEEYLKKAYSNYNRLGNIRSMNSSLNINQ